MQIIDEFLVELGFKVDESSKKKFTDTIKSVSATVTKVVASATAAQAAITAFVTSSAKDMDRLSDLSIMMNTTAESIAKLGYAASQTDSSLEDVVSSMNGLSRVAGEAAMDMGEGREVFKSLGISLKDSNGVLKDTSALMFEIGQAVKDMDRMQQVAILAKLQITPTMLRTLTEDMSGLNAEFDELFQKSGLDMNKAAAQSSDFMDSLGKLEFTFDTLRKSVSVEVMPDIMKAMDGMRRFLIDNAGGIVRAIGGFFKVIVRIGDFVGSLISKLAKLGKFLITSPVTWAAGLTLVFVKFGAVVAVVKKLSAALKAMFALMIANPIGILIAAVAGLLLLFDDLKTFLSGGESLINWQPAIDAIQRFYDFFVEKIEKIKGIWSDFKSKIGAFGASVGDAFNNAKDVVSSKLGLSGSGANINLNQQTTINVTGEGAAETARRVKNVQQETNAGLTRNFRGLAL